MCGDYRNADGTFDGAAAMSAMSGISKEEIMWTFSEMKRLLCVEKLPRAEAMRQIKAQAALAPWVPQK